MPRHVLWMVCRRYCERGNARIQADPGVDGAAGDYREAVSFLRDLQRTLEPLQAYTTLNKYPEYRQDIREQVAHIKEPVEKFLAAVLKFEPSLGNSNDGRHRHVLRKLQWHMLASKKVLALRKKIESHMRVIDTLLQRLTMDMVQNLPENLRRTLLESLRPELIPVLRENLQPLNATLLEYHELHSTNHSVLVSKLSEHYDILSSGMEDIKQQMQSSQVTQNQIESCLRCDILRGKGKALPALVQCQKDANANIECLDEDLNESANKQMVEMVHESLYTVYYLVFLYLGYFLKNLFLVLARMVEPSRALVPTLLPRYNISFLDAIGRPPRVLPYEYFRSFKVLQAFIQHEFRDLPGAAWVERGRYLVMSLTTNRALDERNWSGSVTPGATIAMSMVVQKILDTSNLTENCCPESSCPGKWPKTKSWAKCPVCQKEVLDSIFELSNVEENPFSGINYDDSELPSLKTELISLPKPVSHPRVKKIDLDEDDVSLFKRIVHQTLDRGPDSGETAKEHNIREQAKLTPFGNDIEAFENFRRWKEEPIEPDEDIIELGEDIDEADEDKYESDEDTDEAGEDKYESDEDVILREGGWRDMEHFMQSYGLKPWDKDDRLEAEAILSAMREADRRVIDEDSIN